MKKRSFSFLIVLAFCAVQTIAAAGADFYDANVYYVEDEAVGDGAFVDSTQFETPRPQDVISMVMPVIPEHALDFTLDPQNLLSRFGDSAEQYIASSLYFENLADGALYTDTSEAAIAVNKSSVPVLLYVDLTAENYSGLTVSYTDMASVEADDANNLAFAIVPIGVDAWGNTVAYTDREINIDASGRASIAIYLPGTIDNFEIVDDMVVSRADAVWSSAGFAVRGACNTQADWTMFGTDEASGLKIRATYRMAELTDEQQRLIDEGYVYPDAYTGMIDFEAYEVPQIEEVPETPIQIEEQILDESFVADILGVKENFIEDDVTTNYYDDSAYLVDPYSYEGDYNESNDVNYDYGYSYDYEYGADGYDTYDNLYEDAGLGLIELTDQPDF